MSRISSYFIASEQNNYHPAALSYKAFLIYGLALVILRLLLGASPAGSAAVESQPLMTLINNERASRNLNILKTDNSLLVASSQKAQDMIDRDYFAHVDPDGNYVWPKIIAAGYGAYKILGENLALDFLTSEGMIKAWLDSPTHRANLLHTDFLDQGLTALYGDYKGRYTNLTASLFGAKREPKQPQISPIPPPPQPPPTPVVKSTQNSPTPPNPPPVTTPPTPVAQPPPTPATSVTRPPENEFPRPSDSLAHSLTTTFTFGRYLFTLIGLALLVLLTIDSVIIHRHEMLAQAGEINVVRSHSSYHLTSFLLITLISILIWWW